MVARVIPGFLSIETRDDRPGLVRLRVTEQPPDADGTAVDTPRVRYSAHFNDSEAALMHAHELLKRRLVDADTRLYRFPLAQAIAAADSLGLRHRTVYFDHAMSDAERREIARMTLAYRRRRQRRDKLFESIGYIAIGLLLFNLFFLSLR